MASTISLLETILLEKFFRVIMVRIQTAEEKVILFLVVTISVVAVILTHPL